MTAASTLKCKISEPAEERRPTWKGVTSCLFLNFFFQLRNGMDLREAGTQPPPPPPPPNRIGVQLSISEQSASEQHRSRGSRRQKWGGIEEWDFFFFLPITPPSPPIARYVLGAPQWSNSTTSSLGRENAGSIPGRRVRISSDRPAFLSLKA